MVGVCLVAGGRLVEVTARRFGFIDASSRRAPP
jgi:hypothetical protein